MMKKMETLVYKLKEDIVFPYQNVNINMGRYNKNLEYGDYLGLVYKDSSNKIREVGVLAKVTGFYRQVALNNATYQSVTINSVSLDILGRMKILEFNNIQKKFGDENSSDLFVANIELLEDEIITNEVKEKITKENLYDKLRSEAKKYFQQNNINFDTKYEFNYVKYVYLLCPFLRLKGEYKQKLLEVNDFYTRINEVIKYLVLRGEQLKKLEKANKLKPNTSINTENINSDKNIKSEIIKELMKNQIGSNSKARNKANVIEELEKKINQIKLPEEAKQIALDELEKLKSQGPGNNPEHEWIINYLNTFLKLPWDKVTIDNDDIKKTREILDRDHFGLEKIKKRIIEYLSVRKLNNQENKGKGSILCFNGPPGVGKTSLAKSIAEALGKNFYRLSLGGVRDESEIRGHRRTYIASMPGMIMQSLIRAQTKNPVILLDEIDKVGVHFKGDVSSSLLEVLDPEQNSTFKDHYIGTPFDLSEVFFICTSNYLENVAPPLRDRLEVIEIPGYTIEEKSQICKKYLIPKQIKEKGLSNDQIKISLKFGDDIIESMIVHYTFESGVRQLERNIASVCRFVAKNVVEDMENSGINFSSNIKKPEKINVKQNSEVLSQSQSNIPGKINLEDNKISTPLNISKSESHIFEKTFEIDQKILKEILGKKMLDLDLELRTSNSGVAIGLAYTLNGGAITLIETTSFAGKGQVLITGNMGDVMKESVSTGFSWIKSNAQILGLEKIDFSKTDLHIHVPQAAVPKDGPSAGVTMTVSIVSLLKRVPCRKDTAMTGEISLQGFVLPVGGIKEKCLAAVRNKIKRVILPYQNKHDAEEIPPETKNKLEIIFARNIREVIQNAFERNILEDVNLGLHDIHASPKF